VRQQRAGPKAAWTNYLIFWEVGFLPGLAITAQVTENVYDSPTGHILLIPQGTRIIGQYYNNVGFGQSRVLLVWNQLIFPNGRSTTPFNRTPTRSRSSRRWDFGPKSKVEEGAAVKLGGRFFVIAVSTGKFVCDGNEIMGISTQAPIYAELEGKRAGDAISFNGTELVIEEVA
jgi:hypothetical protein